MNEQRNEELDEDVRVAAPVPIAIKSDLELLPGSAGRFGRAIRLAEHAGVERATLYACSNWYRCQYASRRNQAAMIREMMILLKDWQPLPGRGRVLAMP